MTRAGSAVGAPLPLAGPRPTAVAIVLPALCLAGALPHPAGAQGHGPIYGLSTPTLARGGWSLDVATMARWGEGDARSVMLRPMLAYGITEDVQLSVSFPLSLSDAEGLPTARGATRMPTTRDVEALVAWRFHRRATGIGSRFESTAYLGADLPTDRVRGGIGTAPGLYGALVTGYASRSVYAWAGGSYWTQRTRAGEDRLGDTAMYSLVLGYRPPVFRKELPHPDWRLFVEAVGERAWPAVEEGNEREGTGGHALYVGPTLLGLFGAWGVSGGPLFPVRRTGRAAGDGPRLAANVTVWF